MGLVVRPVFVEAGAAASAECEDFSHITPDIEQSRELQPVYAVGNSRTTICLSAKQAHSFWRRISYSFCRLIRYTPWTYASSDARRAQSKSPAELLFLYLRKTLRTCAVASVWQAAVQVVQRGDLELECGAIFRRSRLELLLSSEVLLHDLPRIDGLCLFFTF